MHSIVNLKTSGTTLLRISGAVTLAAVGYFTFSHHEPIGLGLFIGLTLLFLPHFAFWNRITNSSFQRGLVVIFIALSTLITIHQYWINIFFGREAERVMVFLLVPALQLLLYFFLWAIIRVAEGNEGQQ